MRLFFNWHAATPILARRSLKLAVSEPLESRTLLNATLTSPITSPILDPGAQGIVADGSEELIKLSNHFDNPGGAGALVYAAISSIPGVVQASISTLVDTNDPALYLVAGQVGTSEVTVKATDSGGHSASTTFLLTVGKNSGIVTLTAPTPRSNVGDLNRMFSGTAATGSNYSSTITVTIQGNGSTLTLTTTAISGKFSVAPSYYPTFGVGTFQAYAVQADKSGDEIAGFESFYNWSATFQSASVSPPSKITTNNFRDEQVSVAYTFTGRNMSFDLSSISTSNISVVGPTGNPLSVQSYHIFTNPESPQSIDITYAVSAPDADGDWTSSLNGNYTIDINGTGGVMGGGGYIGGFSAIPVGEGYTFGQHDAGTFVVDIPPALPPKLTGTTIGTPGSYQNDGNTIAKATDGNVSTFFDGPTANGNWVGLDLGNSKTIAHIAYAPRSGYASRMVGGEIQISTTANFTSGVTTIYTIKTTPTTGSLTTVTLSSPVTARYIRYLSPNGSYGGISEFQAFA
jgi:hypothetical protein